MRLCISGDAGSMDRILNPRSPLGLQEHHLGEPPEPGAGPGLTPSYGVSGGRRSWDRLRIFLKDPKRFQYDQGWEQPT